MPKALRAQAGGRCIGKAHAGVAGALPGGVGIGRRAGRLAQPGHDRVQAPGVQVHGAFQPVAAVVAGAAGDPHAARVRADGQRQPRHGQAGALHQRVRGQCGRSGLLDAAGGGGVVQRGGALGGDGRRHGAAIVHAPSARF